MQSESKHTDSIHGKEHLLGIRDLHSVSKHRVCFTSAWKAGRSDNPAPHPVTKDSQTQVMSQSHTADHLCSLHLCCFAPPSGALLSYPLQLHFFLCGIFAEFPNPSRSLKSKHPGSSIPREVMAAASIMGLFICGVVCVSVHVWCVGVLFMHSCGSMNSCACKSQMTHAPCSVIHSPFNSPETGSVSHWP